jgi:hypothetical protein
MLEEKERRYGAEAYKDDALIKQVCRFLSQLHYKTDVSTTLHHARTHKNDL